MIVRNFVRRLCRLLVLLSLPKGALGVEVGVWQGNFSARLLAFAKPRKLYLVDPWHFDSDAEHYVDDQGSFDKEYNAVRARYLPLIQKGQVVLVRDYSVPALGKIDEALLDWAYIDGDHSYEGVKADLQAFFSRIRIGGVLAGDDYRVPDNKHQGVMQAVDDFILAEPRARFRRYGDQFIIKKIS